MAAVGFTAIIIAASLYLFKEPTRSWLVFLYGLGSAMWLLYGLNQPWVCLAVLIVCGMQLSTLLRRGVL